MAEKLSKLMSAFIRSSTLSTRSGPWCPAADVYRTARGWLIKLDLAGVRQQDIQLSVKGCHLKISGSRKDWTIEKNHQFHSMEISYNRFEREIELPGEIENTTISTEYVDGMLFIRLQEDTENDRNTK